VALRQAHRRLREQCVGLVAGYRRRVELMSLEAAPEVIRERNRARRQPVPDAVLDRLADRWETPDPTEAHDVAWISTDR
jgi:tRNA uridine 5-carbamoylmethylation protein Kti12